MPRKAWPRTTVLLRHHTQERLRHWPSAPRRKRRLRGIARTAGQQTPHRPRESAPDGASPRSCEKAQGKARIRKSAKARQGLFQSARRRRTGIGIAAPPPARPGAPPIRISKSASALISRTSSDQPCRANDRSHRNCCGRCRPCTSGSGTLCGRRPRQTC